METTPRINVILFWFFEACREFDDVTSAGKVFHVLHDIHKTDMRMM